MRFFNNLSIAGRLWTAVIFLIVALVSIVGFAGWRSAATQKEAEAQMSQAAAKLKAVQDWATMSELTITRATAAVLSKDPNVGIQFKDINDKAIAEITELKKQIEAMDLTEADRAQMTKIGELRATVLAAHKKSADLKAAGDDEGALREFKEHFRPAVDVYAQGLRDFAHMQEEQSATLRVQVAEARRTTVVMAAVMIVVVLAIVVVGAHFLIRSIKAPLSHAVDVAQRIAEGDLSVQVHIVRHDEVGQMLQALKGMTTSLSSLVGDVRYSTDSISTASSEIATGNQDLSARTEQTASNLQETASSMEQLTGTVKQSADAARQANQLASSASTAAQRGGDVVAQVVTNMDSIATASRKISDIIGVIDGIAFQTNILALNAAVEAARAGEQGRGFAVVASEVRSLAQRSAEAAKEIKSLIADSAEKVDAGSRLVSDAGATMQDIVTSIQRVTDMMAEITASAAEQSDGISQVNQAVTQLDNMTQQNAALVEQSAAAASSLRQQAEHLAQVVSVFRLA
ncbi:methyl-accepting chemotaxis protein [Aquabacterium sp.]|uniref:methyl-accepting chemotaxis protein n=1 Tax=Aquabacterium sp. TaxID=1872578 RepID=UPI0035AECBE0